MYRVTAILSLALLVIVKSAGFGLADEEKIVPGVHEPIIPQCATQGPDEEGNHLPREDEILCSPKDVALAPEEKEAIEFLLKRDVGVHVNRKGFALQIGFPTKIPADAIRHLKGLSKLQSVSLGEAEFTADELADLSALKQVTNLGLSGAATTDEALRHVAGMTSLTARMFGSRFARDAILTWLN